MTETTEKSWLSKNWIWILLLLIAGFLIFIFFHKMKIYEFTLQKTIDSVYAATHEKNKADTAVILKLTDSLKKVNESLSATKQNLVTTNLKEAAMGAEVELLTYKLKHTPAGTLIDSAECQELADKADSLWALAQIQKMHTDSLVVQYTREISIMQSVQEHTQSQLTRTDSALTLTKSAMDQCAVDNKKMVKQARTQSILSKITAGLAIVFLGIVVSDHIK